MRRFLILVLGLALAPAVPAQQIAVTNPGFEADPITPGAFFVLPPAGWATYDPLGIVDQTLNAVGVIRPLPGVEYFPGGTTEGDHAAIVYLGGELNGAAGLEQTLSATLLPDTRYTLSVDIGNIASGTSLPGSSGGPGVFYDLDGFPGYRIELLAGGTVLAADDNSLAASIPEGAFRTASVQFDSVGVPALLGQALAIRLINLDLPGTAQAPAIEVDFDNVRLFAAPVPEPATWVLALAGLGLLSLQRLRRA
jgi:hypothetical protein